MLNLRSSKQATLLAQMWIIGYVVLWLVGCQPSSTPEGIEATVHRVVSGQTIDVVTSKQPATLERVRLIGIDAPDLQQYPWGVAAKDKLKELLSQQGVQSVVLESKGQKDRFGRRFAYVWVDDELINEQLVTEGYALVDRERRDRHSQRLIRAQETARLRGNGIWNPEQPMRLTPQEFRSNRRHGTT